MALTDQALKFAGPKPGQYKLFDTNGLFVIVKPSGSRLWRLRYRYAGKEQEISLGRYPEVTLKDARDRCFEARRRLGEGIDPAALVKK